MIEVLLILVALLLVLACGAFVAAEFAFVTVDRATVDREAERGDSSAKGLQHALHTLSTQLSAAQLGITVTNLLIGFLAEPAIADLIDGPLEALGIPEGAVRGVSVTIAIVLATTMTMLFGELVPKNLAISKPLATAHAVQRFMRVFTRATAVIVRFFNGTANAILRRVGVEPQEELASARSAEELASLVRRSGEQGTLEPETATLLQRSLTFGEKRSADVMTPRERMHSLREEDTVLNVMETARESGRSRLPIVSDDGERILGIVHIKDAMSIPYEQRRTTPATQVMTEPVVVPDTVELDPLLAQLRGGGLQMAVVVNEFGGFDGIVTLEDLVEEIVGEVRDEHDEDDDSILREDDGWSISALLRPDEVARTTGILLPEDEEYETVGGLLPFELGRVPEVGDTIEVEARDLDHGRHLAILTVTAMDGLRVDRVRLTHEPLVDEDDDADDRDRDRDDDAEGEG